MPAKDLPATNKAYPSPFSVRLNQQERNALRRLAAGQPDKPKALEKYKTTQLELPFVLSLKHREKYSRTINLYEAIPNHICSGTHITVVQEDEADGKTDI